MVWYVADQGQVYGPFSEAELKTALDEQRLSPDRLIWRDGLTDWLVMREVFPTWFEPADPEASKTLNPVGLNSKTPSSIPPPPPTDSEPEHRASPVQVDSDRHFATLGAEQPQPQHAATSTPKPLLNAIVLNQEIKPAVSGVRVVMILVGIALVSAILARFYAGFGGWMGSGVADAMGQTAQARIATAEFFQATGRLPRDLAEVGMKPHGENGSQIEIRDGTVVVTVARAPIGQNQIAVEPILVGEYQLLWRCGHASMPSGSRSISTQIAPALTNLAYRDLPDDCR